MRQIYSQHLMSTTELGRLYGVSQAQAWKVVTGKTFRHIQELTNAA